MKTLILYAFHQYNERVEYFINNAIFKDDAYDFIMICNDRVIQFSVPDYVTVIKRANIGYDFGAWSEGLLVGDRYAQYDAFIFVNSSIIGPYLPDDYTESWPRRFLNGLQGNVKLFGSTINTIGDPIHKSHVQSFAFCMGRETLEYLISKSIFSIKTFAPTFSIAIWDYEVRMSREVLAHGWNIGSLMEQYDGVDFTFATKEPDTYNIVWHDDLMKPDLGLDMKKVMFMKGNRGFSL